MSREILERDLIACREAALQVHNTYYSDEYRLYLEKLAQLGYDMSQFKFEEKGGGKVYERLVHGSFTRQSPDSINLDVHPFQFPDAGIETTGFQSRKFIHGVSAGFKNAFDSFFYSPYQGKKIFGCPIGDGHSSVFIGAYDEIEGPVFLFVEKDKERLGLDIPVGGGLSHKIPPTDYQYSLLAQKETVEELSLKIDGQFHVLGIVKDEDYIRSCIVETCELFNEVLVGGPFRSHPILDVPINEINIFPVQILQAPDTVTTYNSDGSVAVGPEKCALMPQDFQFTNIVESLHLGDLGKINLEEWETFDGETDARGKNKPHILSRNWLAVQAYEFYRWIELVQSGREVGIVNVMQLANGHRGTPFLRKKILFNTDYSLFSAFMHSPRTPQLLAPYGY